MIIKENGVTSNEVTRKHEMLDVKTFLQEYGIDTTDLPEGVFSRLDFINNHSNFLKDEQKSMEYGSSLLGKYNYSDGDISTFIKATLLSDLGKAGSLEMTEEDSGLILEMYGVENVPNGYLLTVEDFLKGPYKVQYGLTNEQVNNRIQNLVKIIQKYGGLSNTDLTSVKMPEFWSFGHVNWLGKSCFSRSGYENISDHISSSLIHHILDGVNPLISIGEIDGSDLSLRIMRENGTLCSGWDIEVHQDYESRNITGVDTNTTYRSFSIVDAFVGLVDKYEAFRTRSKMSHEKTIEIMQGIIERAFSEGGNLRKYLDNQETSITLKQVFLEAFEMIKNNSLEDALNGLNVLQEDTAKKIQTTLGKNDL